MKRTAKILTVLIIAITLISFANATFAASKSTKADTTKGLDPSSITATYTNTGTDDLKDKAGQIMGMIRNISAIAAVIIIMVLGVKYMLGSVEEKAEYKKSFMPLIIGIILVVAASAIASFIFNMVE